MRFVLYHFIKIHYGCVHLISANIIGPILDKNIPPNFFWKDRANASMIVFH